MDPQNITARKLFEKPTTKDSYEKRLWRDNKLLCGIDEVGRGCLAGPVVAGAVILKGKKSHLLKDSKLLSQKQLEAGYAWIIKNSWYSVGIINNSHIDTYNIYQATLMAMHKALINLCAICPQTPAAILVDAMPLCLVQTSYQEIPVYHFPGGEHYSSSIAAASIVAKVTRDQLMNKFAHLFPGYHFDKHKGYGTKKHQVALLAHGRSLLHRTSFLNGLLGNREHDEQKQQTFC